MTTFNDAIRAYAQTGTWPHAHGKPPSKMRMAVMLVKAQDDASALLRAGELTMAAGRALYSVLDDIVDVMDPAVQAERDLIDEARADLDRFAPVLGMKRPPEPSMSNTVVDNSQTGEPAGQAPQS